MKSSTLQQEIGKRAAVIKKLASELIDLCEPEVVGGRLDVPLMKSINSIYNGAINIESEIKKLK